MIDVKELRVGSHVECRGKRVEVISLVVTDKDMPPIIGTTSDSVEPADVNPIPITAALLAEIGFNSHPELNDETHDCYLKEVDGFRIVVSTGYTTYDNREWTAFVENWDYDAIAWDDVAHLHNLENLVYNCIKTEIINEE